ncbi:hypothetical protein [Pseudarthrobacter sp. BRE9]|uniref:hypothetical protein n=1 Tax=Pseudarthrobacter sp. BRE9 TaxID=2962582 RepID=UPI0028820737|nr:hypothetical protein [Pseudarthrobacter sp. BRE9]MDT0171031.1 hypothetical protein [Pseudarthrobacter sp. BRE9]
MRELEIVALGISRRFWRQLNPADLTGSWVRSLAGLQPAIEQVQFRAAELGAGYGASSLAAQGAYSAPASFVDPSGFVGSAPDGRSLSGLLYSPVTQVKAAIAGGASPGVALRSGRGVLERNVQTMVADTGRAAASVDIVARPRVGYVRMLSVPSCPRCVVLAGKFFRWNAGFQRHPRCDCRHIPSTENRAKDVSTDPYEYFHGLSKADQDKSFTPAGAQAIRDGGDIFQVVNSRRGMQPGGLVTREGTTRAGNFGRGRQPRLTPEGIYSQGLSRDDTLRLLERNGYILPGGQNPSGVLRGQAEGFGALGRGGTRVGVREAILEARRTGERNPALRATMTAAERRVFDAKANWDAVSAGRNPYGRGKLTPELAAAAENDFRNIIVNGDAAAKITARQSMGG